MKKKRERRNKLIFGACTIVSGAAAMLGINALPVMAAEDVGEEVAVGEDVGTGADAAGELSEDSQAGVSKSGEDKKSEAVSNEEGIYDFKDNKTTGTVTVTGEWDDRVTNNERPRLDIKLSTKKPNKSTLGYTVTFHGNKDAGLVFDDGNDVNDVVYNSSGQIVDGAFKMPRGFAAGAVSWFTDKAFTNKVDVSEDGVIQMAFNGDIDLWIKPKTFEIKGYKNGVKNDNEFNALIPDTVTEIFFTDKIKPVNASAIDVDADGDGGVVAWTENGGTVMKISTQINGIKVQSAKNSAYMFFGRTKLTNIDFSMLNTANVTNMREMFRSCSGLTSLDLTSFDTTKVTSMYAMFDNCSGLTSLDLTHFNTANVTEMHYMFSGCSGLTSLDLTSFDTANVTVMYAMFEGCSGLTSLDLTPLNTAKATSMDSMFADCYSLTSLDLTQLNTAKVTNMHCMFCDCSGLTSLDLTSLNTENVTSMDFMFDNCSGLTSLNLTSFNTAKVTNMQHMFKDCSCLTSLDLTSFNTAKVTNMQHMFANCFELTTIKTGATLKFIGTDYCLYGTWRNTAGETFNGDDDTANFPSNVADTYTRIS